MLSRLPTRALAAWIVLAGGAQIAAAGECVRPDLTVVHVRQQVRATADCIVPQGDRAALTARQELRDEVRMAMADGQITPKEHCRIMCDAGRVLCPEEMPAFEQYLDAMSQCPHDLVASATPTSEKSLLASVKSWTRYVRLPGKKATYSTVTADGAAPMPPALDTPVVASHNAAKTR